MHELINQRCTRCGGRYGVVPWSEDAAAPRLCVCADRTPEIIGIVLERDPSTQALRDMAATINLHTEALRAQEQTITAQRQMIDALQQRCARAETTLDELRAGQSRLRALVRHVEAHR